MREAIVWFFQRVTGAILFVGALTHMYLMHYSGPEHVTLSHAEVLKRLSNPFWIGFNFIFLVSVVYHGLNGVWGIIIEYVRAKRLLAFLKAVIFFSALVLIATGIYILTA